MSAKQIGYIDYPQPEVNFCPDSLLFSIVAENGGIIYDMLTKPVAEAIYEAHILLGWHMEYEALLPYLEKNYPYLFPST